MEITARLDIFPASMIKKNHGLGKYGPVQNYIDAECIKRMDKYTPFLNGYLSGPAVTFHTNIGSGRINQEATYARYLYYGEVFGPNLPIRNGKISFDENDGPIERWVSPPKKYPTGRPLQYNTSGHPLAGPRWFERMKAAEKDEILIGAQEIARRLNQ